MIAISYENPGGNHLKPMIIAENDWGGEKATEAAWATRTLAPHSSHKEISSVLLLFGSGVTVLLLDENPGRNHLTPMIIVESDCKFLC